MGGFHSARCILASVDFAEIEELLVSGGWDEAGELLAGVARGLEDAGAELLVLCTNTLHKVSGAIEVAVGIPVLHIADATAVAVNETGVSAVGLLGTAYTMEQAFYRDRLAMHGLRVIIPSETDRAEVHRIIFDELVRAIIREESRQTYREVIERLVAAGAEGVVLGCTEIELLVSAADSPVPVFPSTRLHIEAAVAASLRTVPRR